jgi:Tol biopolymer transport system component
LSRGADAWALVAVPLAIAISVLADDASSDWLFVTVPSHDAVARPAAPPVLSVSGDGRYIAFVSSARLASADTNDHNDLYVLDRSDGTVYLEVPGIQTRAGIAEAETPRLSATGRFLVFEARGDWGPGTNGMVVLHDRLTGATVTAQRPGEPPDGSSRSPSVSADGRYVAFTSSATNLTEGPDANGHVEDVYLLDVASMSFRRVNVDQSGRQPSVGASFGPAISEDGRYVAFTSAAPLDGSAQASGGRPMSNVYVHDTRLGVTERVSVASDGAPNGSSYGVTISGDGRDIAFVSAATNLLRTHDRNNARDVFVRDTVTKVTSMVSRTRRGGAANGSSDAPAISSDGRIVVFQSEASDLTCASPCSSGDRDINLVADIFVHDRVSGTTRRVSKGRTPWMEPSIGPAVDGTGAVIAFSSRHPLDRSDDRHDYDLFVGARPGATEVRQSATARGTPAGRDTASRTSTTTVRR